jgi:hypothetical protein
LAVVEVSRFAGSQARMGSSCMSAVWHGDGLGLTSTAMPVRAFTPVIAIVIANGGLWLNCPLNHTQS